MYLELGLSLVGLVVPKPVTVATEFKAGLLLGDGRHTGAMGPDMLVLSRASLVFSAYLQLEADFSSG